MRSPKGRSARTRLVGVSAAVAAVSLVAVSLAAGPGGRDPPGEGGTPGTPSLNGSVFALNASVPGVLYVGGAFTTAGGDAAGARLATWSGTGWTPVAAPVLNGSVNAIAVAGGKIYAAG